MSDPLYSFYLVLSEPKPPSVNEMYTTGMHGRRVLTKKGVEFKDAMTSRVAEECMRQSWKDAVDAVYDGGAHVRLLIVLFMPIRNASWKPGTTTKSGARRSRFKKKDAPNYSKAIEDAVADGTGIDDSNSLEVTIRKVHSERSWVEIAYAIHPIDDEPA